MGLEWSLTLEVCLGMVASLCHWCHTLELVNRVTLMFSALVFSNQTVSWSHLISLTGRLTGVFIRSGVLGGVFLMAGY